MAQDRPVIPRIVHQTWKNTEVPEKWKPYQATWLAMCEKHGFEYKLWTDEMNRAFIEENYRWFLKQYDGYPDNIQRCDSIRPFLLFHYGGCYADLDIGISPDRFVRLFELLKHEEVCIAESDNPVGAQNLTNQFMMSQPRQPFWGVVWNHLLKPYRTSKWKALLRHSNYFRVLSTTGPMVICDSVKVARQQSMKVHVIPRQYVSAFPESYVCKHEAGGSWHKGDAKVWKNLNKMLDHKTIILFSVLTSIIVALSIAVAVLRRRR